MKNPYSSTLNVHVSSRSVLSFSSVHRSNTAPVKSGSGTGICQIKSYFFVIAHDTVHHHTHTVHTSPFGLVAFSLRFCVCVCVRVLHFEKCWNTYIIWFASYSVAMRTGCGRRTLDQCPNLNPQWARTTEKPRHNIQWLSLGPVFTQLKIDENRHTKIIMTPMFDMFAMCFGCFVFISIQISTNIVIYDCMQRFGVVCVWVKSTLLSFISTSHTISHSFWGEQLNIGVAVRSNYNEKNIATTPNGCKQATAEQIGFSVIRSAQF